MGKVKEKLLQNINIVCLVEDGRHGIEGQRHSKSGSEGSGEVFQAEVTFVTP